MNGIRYAYASISDLLEEAGSPLSLAELHGGLCGVFCAGGRISGRDWLDTQVDDCAAPAEDVGALAAQLEDLEDECWRTLSGTSMEFQPLLPDDQEALAPRVEALALWCHGFISGLVMGGYEPDDDRREAPEGLEEIVQDLAAISQAGTDAKELSNPESAEELLVELTEYVRVGVQIVFESLSRHGAESGKTIH